MIADERIREYLNSIERDEPDYIERIRKQAIQDNVPIIRRDTQSLLLSYLKVMNATNILEVGTGVAYTSILMAEHMGPTSHITTIEKYPPRIKKARENIRLAHMENIIDMMEMDAEQALKDLSECQAGEYDFIFMDAAKGQYLGWLEPSLTLLRKGGVLFSDNVLLDGSIIESRYTIDRRDRTIHSRMREYLYELKHDDRLYTCIVTIGDGAAVSIKL